MSASPRLLHSEQAIPSVRGLSGDERNALVISMRKVDGVWQVLSQYGDDIWWTTGSPTNVCKSSTKIDFTQIPEAFREAIKACLYRYKTRGREGGKRPSAAGVVQMHEQIRLFLEFVSGLGTSSLSGITPATCAFYVQACKAGTRMGRWGIRSKPLSPSVQSMRFRAVEALHELSHFCDDPMSYHPWPESSADHLSKVARSKIEAGAKTPLMDDDVFVTLFQYAWAFVQSADALLDLRDELDAIAVAKAGLTRTSIKHAKNQHLRRRGWEGNLATLVAKLGHLRCACYVIVASLTGCRNHELGFLRAQACYSTVDDQGERYWWMRSISAKTGEGATEWMIPEAGVTALRVMDRWAEPYQARLRQEIEAHRVADPSDLRIAEAQDHLNAIFVGADKAQGGQVRTLSLRQMNDRLKAFAKLCGLDWQLATHHFRRKFANYAARSRFGDLRYLREHFKHWSLDMTLGYGLNESQEMALYLEIEDELDEIKHGVVVGWLDKNEPLAGGYGHNLIAWRAREESVTFFKSHAHMVRSIAQSTAIRSNGHAWCTADDNLCEGNDINPTKCGDGCSNAVIGRSHAPIYDGLYSQLKSLEHCVDIGEAGRTRVVRDIDRCRAVLTSLGHEPQEVLS